eukprot:3757194-Prymnesium_polylepis.1
MLRSHTTADYWGCCARVRPSLDQQCDGRRVARGCHHAITQSRNHAITQSGDQQCDSRRVARGCHIREAVPH